MNTQQIEQETLKLLYRQELKKLYQAVLHGRSQEALRPQKTLVTHLLHCLGERPCNAAF
ncbi:hypothetical protein [Flaviaesturariibacter amylovorans]|uniref:Uncharacterized protein n=1 Tax=Flaviaesturariibacter amylovorans TaxID=1084520 RepID=A0ABP8HB86_9BACT